VVVTIFAANATEWPIGAIEPLIPAGDWHAFPSRLFVSVAWPSLTDLFSIFWW
jgi:hypothetical protein